MNKLNNVSPWINAVLIPLMVNLLLSMTGCSAELDPDIESARAALRQSPRAFAFAVDDAASGATANVRALLDAQGDAHFELNGSRYRVSGAELKKMLDRLKNGGSLAGISMPKQVADHRFTGSNGDGFDFVVTERELPADAFVLGGDEQEVTTHESAIGAVLLVLLAAILILAVVAMTVVKIIAECNETCANLGAMCLAAGCSQVDCGSGANGGGGSGSGRDDESNEPLSQLPEAGGHVGGFCTYSCLGCGD